MQRHALRPGLILVWVCALLIGFPPRSSASLLLIGPSLRNGSFESGILAPWGSGHDVQVLNDPLFASEGAYYAVFSSALVRPVAAGQNLLANPNDGLVFALDFDARLGLGSPGFEIVSPLLSARTPGGLPLTASITPILTPPLTNAGWAHFSYQLQMPGAWNASGISFAISFSSDQPLGGVTHRAYLDNVVFTQVPEPSSLALFAFSALSAASLRHFRILKSRKSSEATLSEELRVQNDGAAAPGGARTGASCG